MGESHSQDDAASRGPLQLPGFGHPVDYIPVEDKFPVLQVNDDSEPEWRAATLLVREVCMLKFIDDITNKPEWWIKVRDSAIQDKWMAEALALDWTTYRAHADFTSEMARACINELLKKADLYEATRLIPIFDYTTCVIKSDNLISNELLSSLQAAVARLEDVPDEHKDWHPGSDGKVLDLVHPSLWPLIYGRTRILADKRIGVDDCLTHCGMGEAIPEVQVSEPNSSAGPSFVSRRFQWLPCDVKIEGRQAKVDSYINNLHPTDHKELYPVIGQFISRALPAWDIIYRWNKEFEFQRLRTNRAAYICLSNDACRTTPGDMYYECHPRDRPLDDGEPERVDDDDSEVGDSDAETDTGPIAELNKRNRRDLEWFLQNHPMRLPEPTASANLNPGDIKTSGFFNDAPRIQVIIKLANIHLTPENPSYDGGSWHVEGQFNEHICATALFYYENDNISDSHLDFRASANREDLQMELSYAQDDYRSIVRTFDIDPHYNTLQNIGSVLTRSGRAVFFPNLLQHHVSPFELVDKSRPGHRKILALFLVDPAIPIISTANVPPQQKGWWARQAALDSGVSKFPPEVINMILENLDFPIDEPEAKRVREELMAERTGLQDNNNETLKQVSWNFCEH